MVPTHSLSVIIPVLDDAEALSELLSDLNRQHRVELDVVVVDGKSRDNPEAVSSAHDCRFFRTSSGRGRQMNHGAAAAGEELLLFLHADSRIHSCTAIAEALKTWNGLEDRRVAGRFPIRFRDGCSSCLRYRFLEAKTRLNRPGVFNGDQGLLIHRRFFDELGGFDTSRPFLEDQKIGRKIDRRGRWVVFDEPLYTSARRFEKEGFWRRYAAMALMMVAFAGEIDEFFDALPRVYPPQHRTDSPPVLRFAGALGKSLASMDAERREAVLGRIGELVGQNAWQLFALVDVAANLDGAAVDFYDKHLDSLPISRLTRPLVRAAPRALIHGLCSFTGVQVE